MTWWLRSRRGPALLFAIVAQLALTWILGETLVPSPSLAEGAITRLPAIVFLPLVVASTIYFSLEASGGAIEVAGVRRTAVMDAALVASALATLVVGGVVIDALGGAFTGEAARNTAGYVGLGLIAAKLLGSRAGSVAPAAYVVLVASTSSRTSGLSRLWSWPADNPLTARSVIVAGILCVLGLLATVLRDRPLPSLARQR